MTDEELKQLISSNAKAIEALTTSISEMKQEWQKDRRGIYDLLSRLTRTQADFYETQSDFYRRFDEIDERQTRAFPNGGNLRGVARQSGKGKYSPSEIKGMV